MLSTPKQPQERGGVRSLILKNGIRSIALTQNLKVINKDTHNCLKLHEIKFKFKLRYNDNHHAVEKKIVKK